MGDNMKLIPYALSTYTAIYGGVTARLKPFKIYTNEDLWAVGILGHGWVISTRIFSVQDIKDYLRDCTEGDTIGIWVNEDKVYMDHVKLVKAKSKAIILARQNKQEAIFNLKTKETVFITEG